MKRMALSVLTIDNSPIDNSEVELDHIDVWSNNAGREEESVLPNSHRRQECTLWIVQCKFLVLIYMYLSYHIMRGRERF